jgi:DnaJ-class molecular chaperone
MKQKNYYEILQVSESASESEIKQAYRKLAKEYHPDRHPDDKSAEAKFKEIGEAYEVLKDVEKRRKYDELRRYGAGEAQGSMSYEDFINRFGGGRNAGGRSTGGRAPGGEQEEFTWGFGGGLDDIFSQLFGGGKTETRRSPKRGSGMRFDFSGMTREPGAMNRSRESGEPGHHTMPFSSAKAMTRTSIWRSTSRRRCSDRPSVSVLRKARK